MANVRLVTSVMYTAAEGGLGATGNYMLAVSESAAVQSA